MAGICKPPLVKSEASYSVIGGKSHGGLAWNATTNNGLFNGQSSNDWCEPNAWYWYSSGDYIEIQVNSWFRIWRSGSTDWKASNAKLTTKQWNGTAYVDISNSQPTITQITQNQWELTATLLPMGKYRFEFLSAYRIDSEWYIEDMSSVVNSSITAMNIGDYIPCRYTASTSGQVGSFSELGTCTATPIAVTGTSTPDGSFNWIMTGYDVKGRMKLVADRNLQTGISWDVLNTAGIVSECIFIDNLIPIMTSNILPMGIVTANQKYSTSLDAYNLFDRNSGTDYASLAPATLPILIGYEFNSNTLVNQYKITASSSSAYSPKSWTFEGSNDGTNWIILDTQSNIASWTALEVKTFSLSNTIAYKKYRLNINAGNMSQIQFSGLSMHSIDLSKNLSLRLLTGGTSATDKDNEWDKIIVGSTLNGTITAGADSVWHWSNLTSWCSSSYATNSAYKTLRPSSTTNVSNYDYDVTTSTTRGFRPVLLVESLLTLKFLIQDGTLLKAINGATLTTVCNTTDSGTTIETGFIASGMNDLTGWSNILMSQITNKPPKVAIYKK